MQISEALEFVRGRRQGMIITEKSDGRPQSSNIAFYVGDDDIIRISVTDGRAKTKNIRRTGRASLHVNREDFYSYAVIEADVEIPPVAADPNDATVDELVEYYRSLVGEHDDWDDYRRAMVDEGRVVLKLHPTHAYGMIN